MNKEFKIVCFACKARELGQDCYCSQCRTCQEALNEGYEEILRWLFEGDESDGSDE